MDLIKKAVYGRLHIKDALEVEQWEHTDYRADTEVANEFIRNFAGKDRIIILGDYDCDGICASHIARESLEEIFPETKVDVLLPQRKEGYGLNRRMVEYCKAACGNGEKVAVITVDTGITAKEKLGMIKAAGATVVLTDHHSMAESDVDQLPDVDMVINPALGFVKNPLTGREWCGAAIVYKMFEAFLPVESGSRLKCYAGLATVADVITMREGSWQLVRETLDLFHAGKAPEALQMLAMALNRDMDYLTEDDFSYYLAPAFNAPGRLYDAGAVQVLDFLKYPSGEKAIELVEINNERKAIRDAETALVFETIEAQHKQNDNPIWVYVPALHKGIVGIIASNIVEKYGTSACVLTDSGNGVYTGSARSYDETEFDMFAYLSGHKDLFLKMGGHPGAAGFSITAENYGKISKTVTQKPEKKKTRCIPAKLADIPYITRLTGPLRPFGRGFLEPVFEMEVDLDHIPGRFVGEKKNHLSIYNTYPKYKVIHFFHVPNSLKNKVNFIARGTVRESYYKNVMTPEFAIREVDDIPDSMSHGYDYER